MTAYRQALLYSLLAVAAGCASPPPAQLYLLGDTNSTPAAQEANVPTAGSPAQFSGRIGLKAVEMPAYLRTERLYYRVEGKLIHHPLHRWAEPLAEGIERTLTTEILEALPHAQWTNYPWTERQRPDIALKVNVIDIIAREDSVELAVNLTLESADRTFYSVRYMTWRSSVRPAITLKTQDIGPLIDAHNRVVQELAYHLVDTIKAQATTTQR
jgi:uncharacterized lipoprotein YmbA